MNTTEHWSGPNWSIIWHGPYAQSFDWSVYRDDDHRIDVACGYGEPTATGFFDCIGFHPGLAAAVAAVNAAAGKQVAHV